MKAFEFTAALFKALWPPEEGEDPKIWRRGVFVMLTVLTLALSFHITASKGWLEPIGVPAYALEVEVREIDRKTNSILYAIYAPQVRAKIRERCDTNSARERESINRELDRLFWEYLNAAGEPFKPIPRCTEV